MEDSTSVASGDRTSIRAVASCLLGLASLGGMFAVGAIPAAVFAAPAFVLGIAAFLQMVRMPGAVRGKGLAAVGTVASLGTLAMTASLLVPNIGPAREAARRTTLALDLHEIHRAFEQAATDSFGFLRGAICDYEGRPLLSWRVALLPYLDERPLYEEFRRHEPWDSEHNKKLISRIPDIFAGAGGRAADGMTCLAIPAGPGTIFDSPGSGVACRVSLDKVASGDGLSNTILLVVLPTDRAVPWTKPEEFDVEPAAAWRAVRGNGQQEVVVLTCNGGVHTLSDAVSSEDFAAALTMEAGDSVPFEMWEKDR